MNTEEVQKIIEQLQNIIQMPFIDIKRKKTLKNVLDIVKDYVVLSEEFNQVDHECSRLEKKEVELEKQNKKLERKLKEKVLLVRDNTIKMYEENEIKLESRITELENVIIQAIDELKNINFYEPRLKNKNQKEVNRAYSILFDSLKTKER